MTKFIIAIQARLSSTRLPYKILLPTSDSIKSKNSNFEPLIIKFTKDISRGNNIFLLCPKNDKIVFELLFNSYSNVSVYGGDEEDLLKRYALFAESINQPETYIIRLCSDSPYMNFNYIEELKIYCKYLIESKSCKFLTTRKISKNTWKGFNIDIFQSKFLISAYKKNEKISAKLGDQFIFMLMKDYDYKNISWDDILNIEQISYIKKIIKDSPTIDTPLDYRNYIKNI